jgi:hypothetical protein
MAFNPEVTELTTAATDAAIAGLSLGCMAFLRRRRAHRPQRATIWSWVFGLLVVASLLGVVAHGLDLTAGAEAWLWRPLYLSLGLVVALFVVGALYDAGGEQTARRALPPLLALGVAFFVVTQVASGTFIVFVVYEAVAILLALGLYVGLAVRRRLAGAGIVAAGIVLNLVAAGVQATETVSLTIVVPFDHNGVFHFVQMAALVVMTAGLARGQVPASPSP